MKYLKNMQYAVMRQSEGYYDVWTMWFERGHYYDPIIESGILMWFGHMEWIKESRVTKELNRVNVEGNFGRGQPRRTFPGPIENVYWKEKEKGDW